MGERYRNGRKVGINIYRQIGDEPSDADEPVGVVWDSPELAAAFVDAMNAVADGWLRAAQPVDAGTKGHTMTDDEPAEHPMTEPLNRLTEEQLAVLHAGLQQFGDAVRHAYTAAQLVMNSLTEAAHRVSVDLQKAGVWDALSTAPSPELCGHTTVGIIKGTVLICTKPVGHPWAHGDDSGCEWTPAGET